MCKNQKGFSLIEGLLVAAIAGLIILSGWFVYQGQNPMPKTIDAVLSQITEDAKKTYSNAVFENKYAWGAESEATGYNKVEGYDYTVSGIGKGIWLPFENNGETITTKKFIFFKKTIPSASSLNEIKTFVGSQLIKYGFTTTDNKTYHHGDDKCTVLNDPTVLEHPGVTEESNLLDVSCFGKDVLAISAAEMKPFVNEYLKANSSLKASDLSVGPLTIKSKNGSGVIGSSHEAGYDIAEMVVSTKTSKKIALYYSKYGVWHYITQANDEFGFECGAMKSDPDARKAMYDQVCLSENGQVKLDTNNRALQ